MSKYIIRHTVLAFAIAVALSSPVKVSASTSADLFTVSPSTVYQVVHKQLLKNALTQVAQRSGIVFKINTDLGKDVVTQTLAANDWSTAVKALLVGYNYTVVTSGGLIKTVIISGRNETGTVSVPIEAKVEPQISGNTIVISQTMKELPAQYNRYPAGSVLPVSFPVNELMKLGKGEHANIDTPLGQFDVAHDSTSTGADGSNTWIGHLTNEGEGYRMMVSQGKAGIMGHVTTPEGTFSIESTNGSLYLIDTSKLEHLSIDGDTLNPPADAITASDALSDLKALKTALDAAQVVMTTANAAIGGAQTAVDAASVKQAALLVTSNALRANTTQLSKNSTTALLVWNAKRTAANLKVYNDLCKAVVAADTQAKAASANLVAATLVTTTAQAKLVTVKATAATALANYNLALAAYNNASLAATKTPPPIVKPTPQNNNTVVDIMVEYTANASSATSTGYTADYAKQRIAYLVTASNQAYIDSGVNLTIRLVYAEPVKYTDSNYSPIALTDLRTNAGPFADVEAKRTQYGADLVYLFRPLQAKTQLVCGVAYLQFMNQNPDPMKNFGYGVISDGQAQDVSGVSCDLATFTHEIGHSLGLVHDREYSTQAKVETVDGKVIVTKILAPGAYSYSYAWGDAGHFGTIMSYKKPMVMLFSSPALTNKCAGGPCGYDETDTARSSDQTKSLNLTIGKIAALNPTMTTTPVIK